MSGPAFWWPRSVGVGLPGVAVSRFSASTRLCVRVQVVSCSRPGRTGETRIGQPSGTAMTCTFPPWCWCFPDHHRSAPLRADGGHAVGADDRAVQVEVGVPGRRRALQRGGQVGCVVGEHGQPLVQVAVRGRGRYAVVPGELDQARTVDEPAPWQSPCLLRCWAHGKGSI